MTEKIDDLLNEINKNLDLMKLESQKDKCNRENIVMDKDRKS